MADTGAAAGDPPFDGECTVTLVHGTFARRAAWPLQGSRLCVELERVFGPRVLVTRFGWSSRNTIGARSVATNGLQQHLRELADRFPNAKHFVVGHSHGGSIAWQTMSDEALRERVAGIVTLATPFLHAQPRPLVHDLSPRRMSVALLALALAAAYIWLSVHPGNHLLTIAVLGSGLALLNRHVVLPRLHEAQDRTVARFRTPALSPDKALIVRVAGDEASSLLSAAAFASWIATRIDGVVAGVTRRVNYVARWSLAHLMALFLASIAALGLWCGLGIAALLLGEVAPEPVGEVLRLVTRFFGLLVFLPWAVLVGGPVLLIVTLWFEAVASLVLLLIAVFSVPTSFDLWLLPLTVSITPEACPPGAYTLHQFDARSADGAPIPPGLIHSLAYDDERVINLLIGWINERRSARATVRGDSRPLDVHDRRGEAVAGAPEAGL